MSNTLLIISKNPGDMTRYKNCRTQRDYLLFLCAQINSFTFKTIILLKEDKKCTLSEEEEGKKNQCGNLI